MSGDEPTVFRPGGVSYLEISAPDPRALAGLRVAALRDPAGNVVGLWERADGE